MALVEESVLVRAPLDAVAETWRQVELFPRMMDGVVDVRRLSRGRSRWVVTLAGAPVEFEAVTTDDSHRIVWHSVSGRQHCGMVTFDPVPGAGTRVRVRMAARPSSVLDRIALALGLLRMRVALALRHFRDYVERITPTAPGARGAESPVERQPTPEELPPVGEPVGTPGTPFGPVPPFTDPRHRSGY